ncbi:hypothetical protein [Streptomyces sp. 1222.5]|uniref:hypothetical protein n=1 Tax=Streptomyces sp. 1222.5 TaxID=1881026 RepID=UPI003D70B000
MHITRGAEQRDGPLVAVGGGDGVAQEAMGPGGVLVRPASWTGSPASRAAARARAEQGRLSRGRPSHNSVAQAW